MLRRSSDHDDCVQYFPIYSVIALLRVASTQLLRHKVRYVPLCAMTPFLLPPGFDRTLYRMSFSMSSGATEQTEIATFAAGCFWGVEHIFLKHYPPEENKGIIRTTVGYTGGDGPNAEYPSYQTVCNGDTGHAEAVKIEFNPTVLSYTELVEHFYRTHDPTTDNRQGNDVGRQYRSAIFTHSSTQKNIAQRVTNEIQERHFTLQGKRIVTEITAATEWYDAEELHQRYLFEHPHGYQCPNHRLHW